MSDHDDHADAAGVRADQREHSERHGAWEVGDRPVVKTENEMKENRGEESGWVVVSKEENEERPHASLGGSSSRMSPIRSITDSSEPIRPRC